MKTNIKRKRYQTKNRKNNKAKWLILLFFTINALTALVLPYSLDVINGSGDRDYFPKAIVHAEEVKNVPEPVLKVTDNSGETIKEEIIRLSKDYCSEKGLGNYCWKDLVGIAHNEQHDFNCLRVGDNGKSFGCFQIHLGYHYDITSANAQNNEFAIKWTLNRLISKGYPVMRSYAIRSHNGSPTNPKTLLYLNAVNEYIKSL